MNISAGEWSDMLRRLRVLESSNTQLKTKLLAAEEKLAQVEQCVQRMAWPKPVVATPPVDFAPTIFPHNPTENNG